MKCIICGKELECKENIYIMDYGYLHIDCIKEMLNDEDKYRRPISYKRLLEIARKMHLWFFLHVKDESKVYEELGITEEEGIALGYSSFRPTDSEDTKQPMIKSIDHKIEDALIIELEEFDD